MCENSACVLVGLTMEGRVKRNPKTQQLRKCIITYARYEKHKIM